MKNRKLAVPLRSPFQNILACTSEKLRTMRRLAYRLKKRTTYTRRKALNPPKVEMRVGDSGESVNLGAHHAARPAWWSARNIGKPQNS